MNRVLRIILVTALAAVMVVGLTATVGCDGTNTNGNATNGQEPNEGEPDLISGLGLIIDCDEYTGSGFQGGDPAPNFRFQDAAGTTFALSDFQGKSVMLNFWRTTCGFCTMQLPFIQQAYEDWPEDELVILTINIGESEDKVSGFLADHGIALPVLLDREAAVAAQYRVSSIPLTLFLDKEGLIRGAKLGACQSAEELEDILDQLIALQEE